MSQSSCVTITLGLSELWALCSGCCAGAVTSGSNKKPLRRTFPRSCSRTRLWQSLKTYAPGRHILQMAKPVRPAPLPSSKTVLSGRRGHVSAIVPGQSRLGALPCALRSPVSESLRVLYGPFCKVECSVPGDQAGGAMGNDGCALRECDRVPGRLDGDR